MNYPLVSRLLGVISLFIGCLMALSLPWGIPWFVRLQPPGLFGKVPATQIGNEIEWGAILALLGAMAVAVALGGLLMWLGRRSKGRLFPRDAIATVSLSWIMASLLGALPFLLCGVWYKQDTQMTPVDAFFESAGGFSGTGATVLNNLEDPAFIPRCILFWRSETHFLGGLGIMVLFVAVLGEGSAGKALMRSEMAGPRKEQDQGRVQHAAWIFAAIYLVLNGALTALLLLQGMSLFDALCHSFGTVATGGFGTRNDSLTSFHPGIQYTLGLFMFIACINFSLLYAASLGRITRLLFDIEFRVYVAIMLTATAIIATAGLLSGDFEGGFFEAVQHSFVQVSSIQTNTGFASDDFDRWNDLSRGVLFILMFIGGCAGSTSCSIKVIRYILLYKILLRSVEKFYRPKVVRPLRIGQETLDEPGLDRNVLIYFCTVAAVFLVAWLLLVAFEPDSLWRDENVARQVEIDVGAGPFDVQAGASESVATHKLIDSASGVSATINGVGPGLGVVGARQNYSGFSWFGKLVFTALMLLGRLELFPFLALMAPGFWKGR